MSQRQTPENQPPLAHTITRNTQQKTENTVTMVPPSPRLPETPILQVSVIAVHRAINQDHRNLAVSFFDDTYFSFIYFTITLCAVTQCAC
jgi:hypothetical protein